MSYKKMDWIQMADINDFSVKKKRERRRKKKWSIWMKTMDELHHSTIKAGILTFCAFVRCGLRLSGAGTILLPTAFLTEATSSRTRFVASTSVSSIEGFSSNNIEIIHFQSCIVNQDIKPVAKCDPCYVHLKESK